VGMRLAYFACPYPYAFVKRERPRDAKLFYEITENKKCQRTLPPKLFLSQHWLLIQYLLKLFLWKLQRRF